MEMEEQKQKTTFDVSGGSHPLYDIYISKVLSLYVVKFAFALCRTGFLYLLVEVT